MDAPTPAPSTTPLLDAELRRVESLSRQHVESLSLEEPTGRADSELSKPFASMEAVAPPAADAAIAKEPTFTDAPAPSTAGAGMNAPRELPASIIPAAGPVSSGPMERPAISALSTSHAPLTAPGPHSEAVPESGGPIDPSADAQKLTGPLPVPELEPVSPGPPPPPVESFSNPDGAPTTDADDASSASPDDISPKRDGSILEAAVPSEPPVETGADTVSEGVETGAGATSLEAAQAQSPLQITELRPCRKVRKFGVFEPLEADALKAGQEILVYCEMTGMEYRPRGEEFVSRLSALLECRAEGAESTVWEHVPPIAVDVCRHRRRDYYVWYRVTLPPTLQPGRYRLRLIQTDLLAERATAAECALTIVH